MYLRKSYVSQEIHTLCSYVAATVSLLPIPLTISEDGYSGAMSVCAELTINSGTALANTIIVIPNIQSGNTSFTMNLYLNLTVILDFSNSDVAILMNFTFAEASTRCLSLYFTDDTLVEGDETVTVELYFGTIGKGVTLGKITAATIIITDNEGFVISS